MFRGLWNVRSNATAYATGPLPLHSPLIIQPPTYKGPGCGMATYTPVLHGSGGVRRGSVWPANAVCAAIA